MFPVGLRSQYRINSERTLFSYCQMSLLQYAIGRGSLPSARLCTLVDVDVDGGISTSGREIRQQSANSALRHVPPVVLESCVVETAPFHNVKLLSLSTNVTLI